MALVAAAAAGKALAVPGVVEVLETMGRGDDTPSFEEYGASRGDAVAELLGLATGYSDPSPVRDRRELEYVFQRLGGELAIDEQALGVAEESHAARRRQE